MRNLCRLACCQLRLSAPRPLREDAKQRHKHSLRDQGLRWRGRCPSMLEAELVREKTRVTHHMRLQHLEECLGVPQMATG